MSFSTIASSFHLLPFHILCKALPRLSTIPRHIQFDAPNIYNYYNCFPYFSLVLSQQFTIPSGCGFSYCPLNDFPSPRSSLLCHRKMAAFLFPVWWLTYLLYKWKSKPSSQSLTACLHMTLTWCPGMSPGHPRSFLIPEKCSIKRNRFSQMVTPQSPSLHIFLLSKSSCGSNLTVYAPSSSMSAIKFPATPNSYFSRV